MRGKVYTRYGTQDNIEDHPRLCGEKFVIVLTIRSQIGSPPPMRGKANKDSNTTTPLGITPAYAGKSQVHCHHKPDHEDHPRLCGEKPSIETFVF